MLRLQLGRELDNIGLNTLELDLDTPPAPHTDAADAHAPHSQRQRPQHQQAAAAAAAAAASSPPGSRKQMATVLSTMQEQPQTQPATRPAGSGAGGAAAAGRQIAGPAASGGGGGSGGGGKSARAHEAAVEDTPSKAVSVGSERCFCYAVTDCKCSSNNNSSNKLRIRTTRAALRTASAATSMLPFETTRGPLSLIRGTSRYGCCWCCCLHICMEIYLRCVSFVEQLLSCLLLPY